MKHTYSWEVTVSVEGNTDQTSRFTIEAGRVWTAVYRALAYGFNKPALQWMTRGRGAGTTLSIKVKRI